MKRFLSITLAVVLLAWLTLSLLAQRTGPAQSSTYGEAEAPFRAVLTYNPDLFYNLDEQVCTSMAEQLAEMGWQAEVRTVAAWPSEKEENDLVVLVANTYNWAPDWPTSRLIEDLELQDQAVAAIVLGSGSTTRAQRLFRESILNSEADLLAIRSL